MKYLKMYEKNNFLQDYKKMQLIVNQRDIITNHIYNYLLWKDTLNIHEDYSVDVDLQFNIIDVFLKSESGDSIEEVRIGDFMEYLDNLDNLEEYKASKKYNL